MVWKRTASTVTQSNDGPYFTTADGPISHSPLPMDAPSTMAPGPTTPRMRRPRVSGGAGSSPRFHGWSPVRASGASGVTREIVLRPGLPRTPGRKSALEPFPGLARYRHAGVFHEADDHAHRVGTPLVAGVGLQSGGGAAQPGRGRPCQDRGHAGSAHPARGRSRARRAPPGGRGAPAV